MTTIRQGAGSCATAGDFERWAQDAVRAAQAKGADVLGAALEPVATAARNEWYGANGVRRVTGLSGDIVVVSRTTTDKTVIVGVGTRDRRPTGKSGRYVPMYVHRPGKLATRAKVVTRAEFLAAPRPTRIGRARTARPGVNVGDYLLLVISDKASDGKFLLPVFVNGPGRRAVRAAIPKIAAAMRLAIEATRAG